MSRIGNSPIAIPEGVTVEVQGNNVIVKGKLGELHQEVADVKVKVEDGNISLERSTDAKEHRAKHGLYRALIANMVTGVAEGWTKELELVGVGYRLLYQGQKLDIALGFRHNIVVEGPS